MYRRPLKLHSLWQCHFVDILGGDAEDLSSVLAREMSCIVVVVAAAVAYGAPSKYDEYARSSSPLAGGRPVLRPVRFNRDVCLETSALTIRSIVWLSLKYWSLLDMVVCATLEQCVKCRTRSSFPCFSRTQHISCSTRILQ